MKYIVYKTTNIINKKIYIGCHRTNNMDDGYLGSGVVLQKSILKYGKDSFVREVLFIFDNPEEMYRKEIELVNENFIESDNNYNMRVGGWGGKINKEIKKKISNTLKGKKKSKETRKKMSESQKGKKHSEETKKKIGKIWEGKRHSEETKRKMSKSASKNRLNKSSGTIWINDGISLDRRILKNSEIPENWKRGRLKGYFKNKCL